MKLGANLAPTLGSFLQNSVHSFSMGLCVCSLNQAKASVPHGQGPCGMLCIIELSDQVAQATLTSVWVEGATYEMGMQGQKWGGMLQGGERLGKQHLPPSRTPGCPGNARSRAVKS